MNSLYKLSSKSLNKWISRDSGHGPMSKYRKVLDESGNVTSTKNGF